MEDLMPSNRAAYLGPPTTESKTSAVSWGAIFAGAAVAAVTTLVLVVLSTGFDLASLSSWMSGGSSATSVVVVTAIGLIVTQWASAALGGYITGRLRTKWTGTHTHEVFFRDTAHGLLAWAVATLFVASVLASGAGSLVGAGGRAAGALASSTSMTGPSSASGRGLVAPCDLDVMFRPMADTEPKPAAADARAEAGRILARGLANGSVPEADRAYAARLVAAQTGLSEADARHRVDEGIEQMKSAADTARRGAELGAIFSALAMLVGAFIASVSAALGGRLRDEHP